MEEYKEMIYRGKDYLIYLAKSGEKPIKFLCDLIEETYNHKISPKELAKLIEESPLK